MTQLSKRPMSYAKFWQAKPAALAPCHCDPLAENFIDTGERVYVVDWEYAGMNDPMWDLGDLSVEAEFGPEQDQVLLEVLFWLVSHRRTK